MRTLRASLIRFGGLFSRSRREQDFDEEIESHLQMHIEDNLRAGMTPAEARRQALLKLGGLEPTREAQRDRRGLPLIETTLQDIRYALRTFRTNPGFTFVVVLILALGIGANTAIFSLFDAVLLRMIPVKNPEELVFVRVRPDSRSGGIRISRVIVNACFKQMQERASSVSGLAAFRRRERLNVGGGGRSELASGHFVSGSYFSVLGIQPSLGRMLGPDDDRPERRLAVLGYGYWQRRFGGDPGAIGREITVNNVPFTIVGVGPREFYGLSRDTAAELMLPAATEPQVDDGRVSAKTPLPDRSPGDVFGRLKPGVSWEQVVGELGMILRQHEIEDAGAKPDPAEVAAIGKLAIEVKPGSQGLSGVREHFSTSLHVLMAVVGLVMLIACANIANLMLARSSARQREIAIRLSLGSSRWRLIRQLLTESLLLSLAGAAVGLAFAAWARNAIVYLGSSEPGVAAIPVNWDFRVLGFTAAASILTAFLFGTAPALRATRVDLTAALKTVHTAGRAGRFTLGRCLVAGQVAASLALLVAAVLFLSTFRNLDRIDIGFSRGDLLMVTVDAKMGGYEGARARDLFQQATERAGRIPGVRSASIIGQGLLTGSAGLRTLSVPGYVPRTGEDPRRLWTIWDCAGPKFVSTAGLRLLAGRDFSDRDSEEAPKVAIINENAAHHYFAGKNPVGERISFDGGATSIDIVGVVADIKYMVMAEDKQDVVFTPFLQNARSWDDATLVLRTSVPPERLMGDLRGALRSIDPNLPLFDMTTMDGQIGSLLVQQRLLAILSSFFGLLALGLSAVGLYGVISYSVARRTGEIGIRMALGARRSGILRLVLGDAALMVGIGIAIGVAMALSAGRLIESLLFGVKHEDVFPLAASAAVLAAVALVAGYLPARRATRVDPMIALRNE